jgi:hypothetical protein
VSFREAEEARQKRDTKSGQESDTGDEAYEEAPRPRIRSSAVRITEAIARNDIVAANRPVDVKKLKERFINMAGMIIS